MQKSNIFSSLVSLFKSSSSIPQKGLIKLLQKLLSTYALKCGEKMRQNYINIHQSIVLDQKLLSSIQDDTRWIQKQASLWSKVNPLSVIEFVHRSMKYGMFEKINNRWCQHMKNEMKHIQRIGSIDFVLYEEQNEQSECPISFLITQVHLFASLLWQITEQMNSTFLQQIYQKAKNPNTYKQKIRIQMILAIKQEISDTPAFKKIHYYFLKSLNYTHHSFLSTGIRSDLPNQQLSCLIPEWQLVPEVDDSNFFKYLPNSGQIITELNRISSIKENIQILYDWNVEVNKNFRSIRKNKQKEIDRIQLLNVVLLTEFNPAIWKSITYILVMQAIDPQENIEKILMRIKDENYFEKETGSQILIPIAIMLSNRKKPSS